MCLCVRHLWPGLTFFSTLLPYLFSSGSLSSCPCFSSFVSCALFWGSCGFSCCMLSRVSVGTQGHRVVGRVARALARRLIRRMARVQEAIRMAKRAGNIFARREMSEREHIHPSIHINQRLSDFFWSLPTFSTRSLPTQSHTHEVHIKTTLANPVILLVTFAIFFFC